MPAEPSFAIFALASDTAAFDPGHRLNSNLRRQGAGSVPAISAIAVAQRQATLVSTALMGRVDLPFGWHPIDDGSRLLIFDPSGEVQINLSLLARDSRDDEALLRRFEDEARRSYPDTVCAHFREAGMPALGVRGFYDGKQPLEQFHIIAAGCCAGTALHARVTAVPFRADGARQLASLILKSVSFVPHAPSCPRTAVPQSAADASISVL